MTRPSEILRPGHRKTLNVNEATTVLSLPGPAISWTTLIAPLTFGPKTVSFPGLVARASQVRLPDHLNGWRHVPPRAMDDWRRGCPKRTTVSRKRFLSAYLLDVPLTHACMLQLPNLQVLQFLLLYFFQKMFSLLMLFLQVISSPLQAPVMVHQKQE